LPLLSPAERVDDTDILSLQLVVLAEARRNEELLSWPAGLLARAARWSLPVGTELFEEELKSMRQQLRDEKERGSWMNHVSRYSEGSCSQSYQEVWENLRWLPLWFSNLRVVDIVLRLACTQYEPDTRVHFLQNHVVGPAVRVAFWGNIILWSFYAVFPLLALVAGVVERQFGLNDTFWVHSNTGLAKTTKLMLLPYVALLLRVMFHEVKTLVYVLPAQVAMTGPFLPPLTKIIQRRVPSYQGFWVHYVVVLGISLGAHMDLATNALFLSRILATSSDNMRAIQGQWETIWTHSLFSGHFLPFETCVLLMYLLLFGQFLYSLSCSVPLRTDGNPEGSVTLEGLRELLWQRSDFFDVMDRDLERGRRTHGVQRYQTLLDSRTHHQEALEAVAESSRMFSVLFKAWPYKKSLLRLHQYESRHVWIDIKRTVMFLMVFILNESVLQVQLQGSTLEIEKALSGEVDTHLTFSLCLGIFTAWYNLLVKCSQYYMQVRSCLTATGKEVNAELNEKAKFKARASVVIFTGLMAVTTLTLLHATVKVYMVTFQCDCGWNLSFTSSGCVAARGSTCQGTA